MPLSGSEKQERPQGSGIDVPWQAVHIEGFLRCSVAGSKPGPCGLNRRPPVAEWQVRQSRSEWQDTQLSRLWRAA